MRNLQKMLMKEVVKFQILKTLHVLIVTLLTKIILRTIIRMKIYFVKKTKRKPRTLILEINKRVKKRK